MKRDMTIISADFRGDDIYITYPNYSLSVLLILNFFENRPGGYNRIQ